jgi:hypothetical protein
MLLGRLRRKGLVEVLPGPGSLRKVRESVMMANAGIALEGRK